MPPRVRESFIGNGIRVEIRYPAKFTDADIDGFRPLLNATAVIANEIRDRFRKKKLTAKGDRSRTGHVETGAMWESMTVSALSGKRGDRIGVGFPGKEEDVFGRSIRNKDKAWYVTQDDGLSILTPTDVEYASLVEGITANLSDYMVDRLGLEFNSGPIAVTVAKSDASIVSRIQRSNTYGRSVQVLD